MDVETLETRVLEAWDLPLDLRIRALNLLELQAKEFRRKHVMLGTVSAVSAVAFTVGAAMTGSLVIRGALACAASASAYATVKYSINFVELGKLVKEIAEKRAMLNIQDDDKTVVAVNTWSSYVQ